MRKERAAGNSGKRTLENGAAPNGDTRLVTGGELHQISGDKVFGRHKSRRQDALHRAWQPLGERLLRKLQRQASGRTAQRRNLLQPEGGQDTHRAMAPPHLDGTPAMQ